jgi:hypothetical protein
VYARYTRCLGASNSRVIRICSSVGSVTFAVPLLVTAISSVLLLEFLQHGVQPVEALRPRSLVGLHPVMDGLERTAVDPVQALPAVVADVYRSDQAQHPQMLGHLRLSESERAHQVVDGALASAQDVEDLAPPRFGDRVEHVRRGRCSGHVPNNILI